MINLNEISGIIALSQLPSQMRVASSMGDATASIVESVAKNIKDTAPIQSQIQQSQLRIQQLEEYRKECSIFNETPTRKGFSDWVRNTHTPTTSSTPNTTT